MINCIFSWVSWNLVSFANFRYLSATSDFILPTKFLSQWKQLSSHIFSLQQLLFVFLLASCSVWGEVKVSLFRGRTECWFPNSRGCRTAAVFRSSISWGSSLGNKQELLWSLPSELTWTAVLTPRGFLQLCCLYIWLECKALLPFYISSDMWEL